MNDPKWKSRLMVVLRLLVVIVCVVFIAVYFRFGQDISADKIISYAPKKLWLAALFLIALYGIKSLTIFFPIVVLHIVGGLLFPPFTAIVVNLLGSMVELIVPYWVGRTLGKTISPKLMKKYPRAAEIVNVQNKNVFFFSFLLRIISCLPGDVVGMYMGTQKALFGRYLLGSLLGVLPDIITSTLIGSSITDLSSPMFWISVSMKVILTVCSAGISIIWQRKKGKC